MQPITGDDRDFVQIALIGNDKLTVSDGELEEAVTSVALAKLEQIVSSKDASWKESHISTLRGLSKLQFQFFSNFIDKTFDPDSEQVDKEIEAFKIIYQNYCSGNLTEEEFQKKFRDHRFSLAKLLAKIDGGTTSEFIVNFRLLSENQRMDVLCICFEEDSASTISNFKNFRIKNGDFIESFVLTCASANPRALLENISKFPPRSYESTVALLKKCAEIDGGATAKEFPLEPPLKKADALAIALICANNSPEEAVEHLNNFKLRHDDLIEVLKICAKGAGGATATAISSFSLSSVERLYIYLISAKADGSGAAAALPYSRITERAEHQKILAICCLSDPDQTPKYLHNFYVEDSEKERAFFDCLERSIHSAAWVRMWETHKLTPYPWATSKLLARYFTFFDESNDSTKETVILNLFIDRIFSEFFPEVAKKDREKTIIDTIKEENLLFARFMAFLWILDKKIPLDQYNSALELFILIEKSRKQELKWRLLYQGCTLLETHQFPAYANNIPDWKKILTFLFEKMKSVGIDSKRLDSLFLTLTTSTLFKDPRKPQAVLEAMLTLLIHKPLSIDHKNKLLLKVIGRLPLQNSTTLTRAEKETRGKELALFINRAKMIPSLLILADEALLKNPKDKEIGPLLEEAFLKKVPLDHVENFEKKYLATFGDSRDPGAIFRYAGKIASLSNHRVMKDLCLFIQSVLHGTFIQERNSLTNNPHLQFMHKTFPAILTIWQSAIQAETVSKLILEKSLKKRTNYIDWLSDRIIIDNRLEEIENSHPLVFNYLVYLKRAQNSASVKHSVIEKQKQAILESREPLLFEREIVALLEANNPFKERQILNELMNLEEVQGTEFAKDIEKLLKTLPEANIETLHYKVIDTEDWEEIFACGTEIFGSCQSVDDSPDHNKCLLGYLLNGKIRMIAIKGPDDKLIARALIRLLYDGEKPVLFLDKIYSNRKEPFYQDSIVEMAKKKAASMKIPLVTISEEGEPYNKELESFKGPAAFEYVDANEQGVIENGKYTISDAVQL